MPILRKIVKVGDSRAIFIPPSWVRVVEEKVGQPVDQVLMSVNEKITIEPYIKEQAKREEPIELMPEVEEVK